MTASPMLGVLLHAIGGLAAASFYLPFRKVRVWAWESYWLAGGFFSWIVAPITAAFLLNPDLRAVYAGAPLKNILLTYFFGVLWGVGGLTFGLTMRYLGLSLGYALALGFCAAFGTIIPPLFLGHFYELLQNAAGLTVLGGVGVCLAGIAVCGLAGMRKERELSDAQKADTVREFNFLKGVWIAVLAGVMSACMAFAFEAGKPILDAAQTAGTPSTFCNTPVLVVALLGGFTTNCLWCLYLNFHNGTFRDYTNAEGGHLGLNYLFCALAGVTWYFQFFFYGMGTTMMGQYDFSSWTLHMAFIIVFSNLWGIALREWRGTSRTTYTVIVSGILILILSTFIVGYGNYMNP